MANKNNIFDFDVVFTYSENFDFQLWKKMKFFSNELIENLIRFSDEYKS